MNLPFLQYKSIEILVFQKNFPFWFLYNTKFYLKFIFIATSKDDKDDKNIENQRSPLATSNYFSKMDKKVDPRITLIQERRDIDVSTPQKETRACNFQFILYFLSISELEK